MTMQNPNLLYDSRFKDATPAASTTAAGFNVLNLTDWRPYTWWKPTALPATVTVDCASAKAADYCAVWGHDLFTQGATLEVRGSTDNFSASNVLVASKTPTDNKPFLIQFGSVSYRYWRLRITGTTMPSLAIAAIGAALLMPTHVQYGFDPLERTVREQTNRSNDGHPLGKVIEYESWNASLTFRNVTPAWLRATFEPAWKAHLRGNPFLFAWDAGDHADELYLVQAGSKLTTPHTLTTLADLSFDISGLSLA